MSEGKLQYTDSAKIDKIIEFIRSDKPLDKIVYSFRANPAGTFLFNPMKSELIQEFFLEDPEEFPLLVKTAVIKMMKEYTIERLLDAAKINLKVRITDATEIKMRDLDAQYEGIPIALNCQVIGAYSEETYTKYAEAYCLRCGYREKDIRDLNKIPLCPNRDCDYHRRLLSIDHFKLKTGLIRIVMVQEPIEEAQHGSPRILPCLIKDEDVKTTFIGQRKKVIGVFRSQPQKNKATNRIIINAITVQDLEDVALIQPTPEQVKKFEELVRHDSFLEIIQNSFAPEIRYGGTELAKLCIILAILGGNQKGRLRGFIHVLLIGDPSTGKSKILEFIMLVQQKSGFAVGGTSSGAGITITMDTLPNRQKMPRAGIIPLCNGSGAAIDEMNQLEPEDLGKMYEGMESGKMHYNKGGHALELLAETTIYGGANPRGYYYDKKRTILENVHLPGPLISRFDLKVNLLDTESSVEEQNILDHMSTVRNIGVEEFISQNGLLTPRELMLFFNHAKTFSPKISPEADRVIKDFHLMMKSMEQPEGSFKIDKRFFESIGRMCVAYAKLHLKNTVTKEMAMYVIEIYKRTLGTFGMNTEQGEMQLSMQDGAKTKEMAFQYCFKDQQSEQEADYIQEELLLLSMVKHYPHFWKNTDIAGNYFELQHKKGNLVKRGGRYSLG